MPLPIIAALPWLAKGVVVAVKFVATHHAQAAVLKGAVVATKTMGAANAMAVATTGLVVLGAGVWTIERVAMVKRALKHFDAGEPLQAASELTKIARSCFQVTGDDVADMLRDWMADGASVDSPHFASIISALRQVVDEAAITSRGA